MSPVILVGAITVTLALALYTIGVVAEQRSRRASHAVLGLLSVAVVLDLVATGCMMLGSKKPWFTPHGLVGYSALAAMVGAVVWMWKTRGKGPKGEVPGGLHLYVRLAYLWWVVAYLLGLTGSVRR